MTVIQLLRMNNHRNYVLLSLAVIAPMAISQFLGPATLTIKRLEKCGEDAPGFNVQLFLKKLNRTHLGINGHVNLTMDIDETIPVNLTVAKWGDGGWKPHFLDVIEPNACEFFMKYVGDQFKEILATLGSPEECPIAKGIYDIKDILYDGQVTVPLPYGDFRAEVLLRKDGQDLTCVLAFVTTEPKKS